MRNCQIDPASAAGDDRDFSREKLFPEDLRHDLSQAKTPYSFEYGAGLLAAHPSYKHDQ
jgi:hypothetical protein